MNKLQCPIVQDFNCRIKSEKDKLEALWMVVAENHRHRNSLTLDQALIQLATNQKYVLEARNYYAKLVCSIKY